MTNERLLVRELNASNHLAGLDSHLVVLREDLERIHQLIVRGAERRALEQLERILDGENGERAEVRKAKGPKLCGIPSRLVGACDKPAGHAGDLHSNAGDGFYARDYEKQHAAAQRLARKKARRQLR